MSRASLVGLAIVAACSAGGRSWAETVDEAHAASLNEYYAGRYQRAVDGMERILALPLEDPVLHYNLGCAYFRLERLGFAIYHFERALVLDPSAEDAGFNLRILRSLVEGRVRDEIKGASSDPLWVRAATLIGERGLAVLFLVLWWLSWGTLLLLRYISPGPARAGLIASGAFVGLLTVVCGLLLAARIYLAERVTMAIVLPDRLGVYEGPDESTKVSFRLHAGLRVRLQGSSEGWVRIRLANGLEGWVRKREVGVL